MGQRGPAVGFVDAAIGSAVSATSSANNAAHGARAAVDGDKRTYWASKPGDVGAPVELVIDFGSAVKLERLDVDWEFPAKSFSIALSEDGLSFQEVFATDVNVLNSTSASVGSRYARKAKVSCRAVLGRFALRVSCAPGRHDRAASAVRSLSRPVVVRNQLAALRIQKFASCGGEVFSCSAKR